MKKKLILKAILALLLLLLSAIVVIVAFTGRLQPAYAAYAFSGASALVGYLLMNKLPQPMEKPDAKEG